MKDVQSRLHDLGVIPVIAIDHIGHALGLADALLEGGLPMAEITFRTAAAAEVIAYLHERRPELLIGAGTILDITHLALAQAAGAKFGLSPGVDASLIEQARKLGMPYFPGAMTPTDFQTGLRDGVTVFKFFPATAAGGLPLLRAILAPFAHLELQTIPAGGITPENLIDWLKEPLVLAVGGTSIATRQAIAANDWLGIRDRAKRAVATVATIRAGER